MSPSRHPTLLLIAWLIITRFTTNAQQEIAKPSATHLRFYEDNVGIMITFNMQTFVPPNERQCCNTWNPDTFNPYLLNTDVWLQAAHSFGAKYAVMVCDHFSGFSMYPTEQHEYSVKYSKWQNGTGNVIKSFVQSAYKYNIRPAIYYSVHENWYYNVSNFNLSNSTQQQQFQNMALAQMNEIADIYHNFGSKQVAEIWFDAGVKQSLSFVNQVNTLVLDTIGNNATCHSCENMQGTHNVIWMGNEQAQMPYPNWGQNTQNCNYSDGTPDGTRFCAAHCDAVLREHIWFWQPNPPPVSSATTLISKYLTSVGRGCNLIMNMAPNMTGLLLQEDIDTYNNVGQCISKMFTDPARYNNYTLLVNDTSPVLNVSSLSIEIPILLNEYQLGFGAVELRENIVNGQRIESYSVEIRDSSSNVWYILTNQKRSLTIGNKRIQTYNVSALNIKSDKLRVSISSYIGEQDPELVQMKSVKLFDWTYLAQNDLADLDWNTIIQAGQT